ncbi:alpha/beta hydrolase, partial [Thermodesulfobacteriota bacterium]
VPSDVAKEISNLETIWLDTSFGRVETWFLPAVRQQDAKPAPAVIFAHGNGELIDFWPHELKKFTHLGLGVMLVEYPGYGRSEGAPSQRSIAETFITAYDRLAERDDVDGSRIVLFGRSLGGGAVCLLAARRPSAALILMSTFTSARSFASRYLAPQFLVRDPLDNLPVVESYAGPVLIMHGTHDEVIPYRHGVSLHRAAKQGKMITYNSGHNDCPPNWGVFWQDVESFLSESVYGK